MTQAPSDSTRPRARPSRQRGRGWLIAVVAIVAVVAVPVVLNRVSVQPGAAMVRAAFEAGPAVTVGPDFDTAASAIDTQFDIPITVAGAPDATIDIYSRPSATDSPMILWVHGGGFLSGDSRQVGPYATMLAAEGYVVASLDYSIAPAAKYPTPIQQGNAALDYLEDNAPALGGDSNIVFVGGDSAGAQIASQLAAVQTNPALAEAMGLTAALQPGQLRGAVLFCGLYDMSTVGATGFPALRTFLWSYTGYRDWLAGPVIDQLSTTQQATADYPPAFIGVGDTDPFQTQGFELAAALKARGVDVTTQFWNGTGAGLGHEYQFNFTLPEARETFTNTLKFLSANSGQDHS